MKHKRKSRILSLILSAIILLTSVGFMPSIANATPNATAVQVATGANHTLVRLSNGEVWAWGRDRKSVV